MPGDAVTLETKSTKAKGRVYTYRVLRWTDPDTGKRLTETLGRADDRRHTRYITLREAKKLRDLKAAEFDRHPGRRRRGLTLGELIDWYADKRKREGVAARTREVDAYAARLLLAYFKTDTPLAEIPRGSAAAGVRSARGFWFALRDGELAHRISKAGWSGKRWSQTSAMKYLRNARAMFNAAVDDEILESHPFNRLAGTTAPADESWRLVTRKEAAALIRTALEMDKVGWAKAVALARYAAHTREDLLANTWTHVDFATNEVRFRRSKSGAKQHAPIDDDLLEWLVRWHEERSSIRIAGDTIIRPGELVLDNPGRDMARICKRAGVEPYGKPLHALRKSCITDWVSAGHPPHAVQLWAGHENISTTLDFYTRVSPQDMAAAKANADAAPLFRLSQG